MSLKLVLVSPSGTLVKDNILNDDHISELCQVIRQASAEGIKFVVWSNRTWSVQKYNTSLEKYLSQKAGVEVFAAGVPLGHPVRQRSGSIKPILDKFQVKLEETILVGANREDLQAGVNNKLLLLRPAWYGSNLEYGFELKDISELARFCLIFGTRENPFFWQISDTNRRLYAAALGPYSTRNNPCVRFSLDAVQEAKHDSGTSGFWSQLIISTLYFSGLIHRADLILAYPGHCTDMRQKSLYESLSLLGKCFRKKFYSDLLLRHQDVDPSKSKRAADRQFLTQINSLQLNSHPSPHGVRHTTRPPSLAGNTALVIDDICTSGCSLDAARCYLMAAGMKPILFSWLKTINAPFRSMQPPPNLNPYEINKIDREPNFIPYPYDLHIIDHRAPAELDEMLDRFQKWGA